MPMRDAEAPDEEALRAHVSSRLAQYQSPAFYLFASDLPRNSTGKFDRRLLLDRAVEILGRKTG